MRHTSQILDGLFSVAKIVQQENKLNDTQMACLFMSVAMAILMPETEISLENIPPSLGNQQPNRSQSNVQEV